MKKLVAVFACLLVVFFACKKEEVFIDPPPLDAFDLKVSPFLKVSRTAPDVNPTVPAWVTKFLPATKSQPDLAELGRIIFYDKKLSKDGTVACANCHRPELAFSDDAAFSTGIFGRKTKRNSMALANTFWFGGYLGIDSVGNALLPLFWDSRAPSISVQSRGAFTNENEMGMTMPEVVSAMSQQPYYQYFMKKIWGDSLASEERVFTALTHFMAAVGVNDTRFDRELKKVYVAGQAPDLAPDFTGFTPEENLGKTLYLKHCNSCHSSLTRPQAIFEANNGLEKPYVDQGKGGISGKFYEVGIFKVPGLRNIELSAPYMHDGRFKTLEEVVEHYNSGVQQVFGLHGDLLQFNEVTQTYKAQRLNLTSEEKSSIVAFLKTLTNNSLATDERFSNPFK